MKLRTSSRVQTFILFPGYVSAIYFLERENENALCTYKCTHVHDIYREYEGIDFTCLFKCLILPRQLSRCNALLSSRRFLVERFPQTSPKTHFLKRVKAEIRLLVFSCSVFEDEDKESDVKESDDAKVL